MERRSNVAKNLALLFECSDEEGNVTPQTTSDGVMKEERDTTLHKTSDKVMEEERDRTLHTTSDGGMKVERNVTLHMTCDEEMVEETYETLYTMNYGGMKVEGDVTLHATRDGSMKEERDTALHMTSDGGMKVERDATQHMTTDGGIEGDTTLHMTSDGGMKVERHVTQHMTTDGGIEEGDTTLHMTSDGGMKVERHVTQHMTTDGGIEEGDTTLHMTSDGGMKVERHVTQHMTTDGGIEGDTTLHMTSDGGMKVERHVTQHMTTDGGIEEERDATLHMTSDGGIEEERDATQHMTANGGIEEERDTNLHTTSDEGMEEERDATLHTTSDGRMEEERDSTLQTTSDKGMEEERDATLHTTSDGRMEEERDSTLQTTSDRGMEEERDSTLDTTSDGRMEEERDSTVQTTSDGRMEEKKYVTLRTISSEWMEEEMDLDGEADLDVELSDEASETEDNTEFDPDHHSTDEEESEEESEVTADTETAYQSKNGNISWTSKSSLQRQRGRLRAHRIIKMTPGPTRLACANADDIRSTFELFFPDDIKQILIEMTNLEGKRVFRDTWKDLDWTDLQAYIGLLFLAGVYRSHHEAMDSLWHAESGRPIFRATMSQKSFKSLSRVICFYKKDKRLSQQKKDKLAPVRNIWDKWVQRLPLLYNPGPNVTVDECLVRFRGRCPFKQYMPSKPGKYGIKIWAACDARSSYAWNLQIYTGKAADGKSEKNQGMRVVLDMTDGLEGHTITCDNFFTSYALGQELLRRKMSMIGTVRSNKPELPPALLSVKNRARLSSMFAFTDTHSLVSYCPRKNKNVLLMSTFHRDGKVSNKDHKKPEIILDYNHTKGGVDNLDKLVATYTCQRKASRWPMVIFFNMLDVSAYNAFVLWMEINHSWNKGKKYRRRLFLEELGRALVAPLMTRREKVPRTPASQDMVMKAQASASPVKDSHLSPVTPGKRKRCQVCDGKKDTKTSLMCSECNKYICRSHAVMTAHCQACSKV